MAAQRSSTADGEAAMPHIRHMLCVCALLLLPSLGACSPSPRLAPVSGTVVFDDGMPVTYGTIEFMPDRGGAAGRGTIDGTGRFAVTTAGRSGAVAGRHRVIVTQFTVLEGVAPHRHPGSSPASARHIVDPRYAYRDTSGLDVVVKPDTPNDLVITVSRKHPAP
jgi:hypothetical protein